MGVPNAPVTLTAQQVKELNEKLSFMRHDVNNHVGLMIAAIEMIQFKPDLAEKMMANLMDQMPKVTGTIAKFSEEFEKTFGITRP